MLRLGLAWLVGACVLCSCGSTTGSPANGNAGSGTGAGTAANAAGSTTTEGGSDALSGAGTAGRPSTTATRDVTTPAGFCQGYYALATDLFKTCWTLSEQQAQGLFDDPALCRKFVASVTDKRLGFDGTRAAACLDEVKAVLTCNGAAEGALAPHCDWLQPLVPTGGVCTNLALDALGHECQGDDYCLETEAYSCGGICTARAAMGAACDTAQATVRCAKNATCDSTTRTCVAMPDGVELNGACGQSLGTCNSGLFCDRATAVATGVCHVPQTSGPCLTSQACALPSVCAGASAAKSCVPQKQLGEACTPGIRECNFLAHCDADHLCSDKLGAVGEQCGLIGGESFGCQDGTYCSSATVTPGTCQPRIQAGAACDGSNIGQCLGSRAHCDAKTSLCVSCD